MWRRLDDTIQRIVVIVFSPIVIGGTATGGEVGRVAPDVAVVVLMAVITVKTAATPFILTGVLLAEAVDGTVLPTLLILRLSVRIVNARMIRT